MVDERSNDPQKIGRGRYHFMDQSELNPPDETQWVHSLSQNHSQIFGKNGEKFADGEHGIGETPNAWLKGTKILAIKAFSDNQTLVALGAVPTDGGDNKGDS